VAGVSPLLELRSIRDQIRLLDAQREDLINDRDRLIRLAVDQGKSEGQIAEAAGLSPGRVNQIKHSR